LLRAVTEDVDRLERFGERAVDLRLVIRDHVDDVAEKRGGERRLLADLRFEVARAVGVLLHGDLT
jgi:hypothetical protein